MNKSRFLALLLALAPSFAMAQGVPRIKAVVVSFDGKLITVKTADPEPMQIGLMPSTRIMRQEAHTLADIKPGAYIGATITNGRNGSRRAQEIHIFPESLRGDGEGLFAVDKDHFMIDGTVTSATPNLVGVDYRGGGDADAKSCTGRAPVNGKASCKGHADIMVAPGVPVTGLADGDTSLLVPGTVLVISIVAGGTGHPVTPGLTVQGMAAPSPPAKQADTSPASQSAH